MTERVYQYIKRLRMIEAGDRVAVAVSGGADSVALLELLLALRERLGITLAVAHFDHRLRGAESEADARFVEQLAARHGLPFFCEAADVAAEARRRHGNLEGVARELRYRFFHGLVESGQALKAATGHTADDQAETVLARLLRGSGTRGLAGIYPVVDGWLIRPLLEQRRADLRAWLAEALGAPLPVAPEDPRAGTPALPGWREDSSNCDPRFTRNRLRAEVLPLLERFNPRLIEHLAANAEIARDEEDYWNRRTAELLAQCIVQGPNECGVRNAECGMRSDPVFRTSHSAFRTPVSTVLKLALGSFVQLHRAEQRRVLRAALGAAGYPGSAETAHIEALRRLATGAQSGQRLCLSGLTAVRVFDVLEFRPGTVARAQPYEYRVTLPGGCIIAATQTRLTFDLVGRDWLEKGYNNEEEYPLDLDYIQNPLVVRNWHPGDVFESPAGRGTRKIKTLLLRHRIPAEQRRLWPVVVSGQHIVWVRGFPVARSFRMTAASKAGIVIREEALTEEAVTEDDHGNIAG